MAWEEKKSIYLSTGSFAKIEFLEDFSEFFIQAIIKLCPLWYILHFNLLHELKSSRMKNYTHVQIHIQKLPYL